MYLCVHLRHYQCHSQRKVVAGINEKNLQTYKTQTCKNIPWLYIHIYPAVNQ